MPKMIRLRLFVPALFLAIAGCTLPDGPVEVFDPFEEQNRRVHEFNKRIDQGGLKRRFQLRW